MSRKQISTTAHGIAAARALESERPAAERICYDPYARRLASPAVYWLSRLFAGYGERRAPGVLGYLVARTRYIDDYLQACLARDIRQLVILGAGLDSRAYRFDALPGRVRVFEVDQPATLQDKIERVKKLFGCLPGHVTCVPIDFNEDTLDRLHAHGYDAALRTLFIWEGVTFYLQSEAVDATLAWVGGNVGPGSSIIFDYMYREALTAAHRRHEINSMQRYRRFTGEALTFGIPRGTVEDFLAQRGYHGIVNAGSEELRQAYFGGTNADRPVAPIYAIVYAMAGPPR